MYQVGTMTFAPQSRAANFYVMAMPSSLAVQRSMQAQFDQAVDKELSGREAEPQKTICFKLSQTRLSIPRTRVGGPQLRCRGQTSREAAAGRGWQS
jgi:hypothetical protein